MAAQNMIRYEGHIAEMFAKFKSGTGFTGRAHKQPKRAKLEVFIQFYISSYVNSLSSYKDPDQARYLADKAIWQRWFAHAVRGSNQNFPWMLSSRQFEQLAQPTTAKYTSNFPSILEFAKTVLYLKEGHRSTLQEDTNARQHYQETCKDIAAEHGVGEEEACYRADVLIWNGIFDHVDKEKYPFPYTPWQPKPVDVATPPTGPAAWRAKEQATKMHSNLSPLGTSRKKEHNASNRSAPPIKAAPSNSSKKRKVEDHDEANGNAPASLVRQYRRVAEIWEKLKERFQTTHRRAPSRAEEDEFNNHYRRVWSSMYEIFKDTDYADYRADFSVWSHYLSDQARVDFPYPHYMPNQTANKRGVAGTSSNPTNASKRSTEVVVAAAPSQIPKVGNLEGMFGSSSSSVSRIPDPAMRSANAQECDIRCSRTSIKTEKLPPARTTATILTRNEQVQSEPQAKRIKLVSSQEYYDLTRTDARPAAATAPVKPVISIGEPARVDKTMESVGDTNMNCDGEADVWFDALLKNLEPGS